MPLNADSLLDRARLKRLLTRWRILAILAVVVAVLVSVEKPPGGFANLQGDFIARLTVDGIIYDDLKRDELIEDIGDDPQIKAVMVRIDSPGGSAVGGEQFYRKLLELGKKKPVVAVMREMATSAGYMIAIAADQVFAMEGTITGSIGVMLQMAEVTELAKKLGVEPITIKSGALKGSPSPFEKFTQPQREMVQQAIDGFYQVFVDMVVTRRSLPRNEVVRLADGRIYTGRQAVENKLIDAIGGEKEAMQWLAKNKKISAELPIEDVEVKEEFSGFLDELTGIASKNILAPLLLRLDGLALIWQPNAL